MGHNLSTVSGRVEMAYAGQTPWHRLGTHLPEPLRGADMLLAAGQNYDVRLEPAFRRNALGDIVELSNARITVRYGEGADLGIALGLVKARFVPLQNAAAYEALRPLEDEHGLRWETAGVLGQGERIWALGRLPAIPASITRLNGAADRFERFVLLANGHDGSLSLQVRPTLVRVVCQNTLQMAVEGGREGVFIRHTENAEKRVAEAGRAIVASIQAQDRWLAQAGPLATVPMTEEDFAGFAYQLLRGREQGAEEHAALPGELTKLQRRRTASDIDDLIGLFQHGHGNTGETLWDGFNAVTEWIDHHRVRYAKSRQAASNAAFSAVFGEGERKKHRAFRLLLKRAGGTDKA